MARPIAYALVGLLILLQIPLWFGSGGLIAMWQLSGEIAEQQDEKSVRPPAKNTDSPPPVGLRLRAYPLIQLLSAAARQECDVMWDEGAPLV